MHEIGTEFSMTRNTTFHWKTKTKIKPAIKSICIKFGKFENRLGVGELLLIFLIMIFQLYRRISFF